MVSGDPTDDQGAVVDFLGDPATHGVETVERIETHGAIVFLAGPRAYKIKRAVRYAYMDFSTLERRRLSCETELALNRRTAPSLYRDTTPIVRRPDGSLALGGDGQVLEWAVVMARFDQATLWDAMARTGELTRDLVLQLADHVVGFHRDAAPAAADSPWGGAAPFGETLRDNLQELDGREGWFPSERIAALRSSATGALDALGPLLDRRKAVGKVRRCHGDLHLRNICLVDGKPTLFDAIEFNESLGWIDLVDDVAFLLMDLEHRELRVLANAFANRYLLAMDDFAGLATLPLFLADRALVLAKVAATTAGLTEDKAARATLRQDADGYLDAAEKYLRPPPPALVAIGGLSGTGKTSVAAGLAPHIGAAPGAIHLRTDVLRKRLFGVPEAERLPESAYTPDQHDRVFALLFDHARTVLAAGHAVLLDGVFGRPEERATAAAVAADAGVSFTGIWLEAPESVLVDRVTRRRDDASDATAEIVRRQGASDLGTVDWHRLRADRPLGEIVAEALRRIPAASAGKVSDTLGPDAR